MSKKIKVWSNIGRLPYRNAGNEITKACLVLEGGAFRGVYGEGVTDYLMYKGLNFETIIGVSAGALNGYNIAAGQIGRAARINLTYRHDTRYVGIKAIKANHGVYGFDFAFNTFDEIEPLNRERLNSGMQRLIVVATDCETGKAKYFENGKCENLKKAIQASASLPYISKMVEVEGRKYLDGGSSDKIPYRWAIDQGYEKIVVISTRPKGFRKPDRNKTNERLAPKIYHNYPEYAIGLIENNRFENNARAEMEELEKAGRIFTVDPPDFVNGVSRMEPDLEKLGHLYMLGFNDAKKLYRDIMEYLGK